MKRTDTVIKILPAERFTPFALAKKLEARVILESSSYQQGRERYSLLMTEEAFRVEQRGKKLTLLRGNARRAIKSSASDILDLQLYFANQHALPHQDFPFPAGGVGYLSFEFAAHCDTIRFTVKDDPLELPDAAVIFGHVFVVFDHYSDLLYLIGLNYDEDSIDLEAALGDTEARINDLDFNYLKEDLHSYPANPLPTSTDSEAFKRGVEEIRGEIERGNLLQAVLSRRVEVNTSMPALEAYRRLRTTNPAPYLFYLNFGDYELFGSSPEMHLRVRDGLATVRPIAGTRRRGESRSEDAQLAKELSEDEKERAEHLMLVDLARNDLGRVSVAGSVTVESYMQVEYFSHVMHLVSEVTGKLEPTKSGADALRATFPAGTVSGAPKIRAIEVLDRIEALPRRYYAGVVGYVEPGGNLDTCIAIRSAIKKGDVLILQAGAGIVYDSRPERELEETQEKLAALAVAIGLPRVAESGGKP